MRTLKSLLLMTITALALTACGARANRSAATPTPTDRDGKIVVGGLERTYILHLPPAFASMQNLPLVIILHGGGGTGKGMITLTRNGMNALADQDKFVVVYPDGIEKQWNDGRQLQQARAMRENVDDVGFIAALINDLSQTYPIDRTRVYVAGISNGGMMSERLACDLADQIAAIGVIAAPLSENLSATCQPSRSISVVLITGTADPLVPYQGGEIGLLNIKRGKGLSSDATTQFWVSRNQCANSPSVSSEPIFDAQDVTRVRKQVYAPCREGSVVVRFIIEGGGHTWPNGWQYLPEVVVGKTTHQLDANVALWEFFKSHKRESVQ